MCVRVHVRVRVFLLTVTVDPPQLALESGKTSTLLDVVSRPQTGKSHTVLLAFSHTSIHCPQRLNPGVGDALPYFLAPPFG